MQLHFHEFSIYEKFLLFLLKSVTFKYEWQLTTSNEVIWLQKNSSFMHGLKKVPFWDRKWLYQLLPIMYELKTPSVEMAWDLDIQNEICTSKVKCCSWLKIKKIIRFKLKIFERFSPKKIYLCWTLDCTELSSMTKSEPKVI